MLGRLGEYGKVLGVVWGLGVEVMMGHSVALDERAGGGRVWDDSEHCSGVRRFLVG